MTQGNMWRHSRCALVAWLTFALFGCPSGTGEGLDGNGRPLAEGGGLPPPALSASFESLQANIFTPACTVCHAGAAAPVGLKLDAGNSFAMLVGAQSAQVPGQLRVVPGDPDNSYLMQKIEGTAAVGQQMPLGGPFLGSAEVAQLRAWIAAGAQPPVPPAADVPPVVVSIDPVDNAQLGAIPESLTVVFSKPMDVSLVSDMTVILTASGADGVFGDAADQTVQPAALLLTGATLLVDLTDTSIDDDDYQLRLVGSGATVLADQAGLKLDGNGDGVAGDDFVAGFVLNTQTPPPEATWRSLQDEVFTPVCVTCHVVGGQAAFLLLDEANSYAALVGVPSTEEPTLLRVEPLDAAASYLVQKLEGTASVGAQMPLGGAPLPASTVAAVRAWIDMGAVRMPGDPLPDVLPPVVVVAAPLGVLQGTVTLAANASDASGVASVEFQVDGAALFVDTVEPYEAVFDTTVVTDGDHVVTAIARDAVGNAATSSPLTVTVNNAPPPDEQPPLVTLSDPGAELSGVVTLQVAATDNVGVALVRFFADGTLLGTDNDAPFALDWDTTSVSDGAYNLTAQAQDEAGNSGDSTVVSVTVNNAPPPDTTEPVVTLSVPASPLAGTVVLAVSASDATGVTEARVFVDDVLLGTDTQAPYQFDFDTTSFADGDYSVRAEAVDAAGNLGLSPALVVTIDNTGPGDETAPVVTLDDPAAPLTGLVTITASADDDVGVVDVTLLVDGVQVSTVITVPYTFELDTTLLSDGAHTLRASARDAAGNVGQSLILTVTVDNADRFPPVVMLIMPPSPANGSVLLTVNATDNDALASVEVFVDDVSLGQVTAAPFEFDWDTTGLTDANHVIRARATDASGNVGAAPPLLIAVANGGPQPTLAWVQQEVFDVGCAAGCHVADGIAPFLRLDAANAFADLVNVPASLGGSSLRVTPGDADDSALVQRLEGTLSPSMPLGGSVLPTAQINAVRAWIDGGALVVPADVIAPGASLGALDPNVRGTITFDAFAVDDIAVTDVRFVVNGTEVGSTGTAPYQLSWDSRDVVDGTFAVLVRAMDAAGNVGESPALMITVTNPVLLSSHQQESR